MHIVLDAGQCTQLAFYYHAMGMGIFYYLAGQGNVLLKTVLGTVDHYRAESAVHTGLADVKVCLLYTSAENTLFLLNQYSAGFSKKTQSPPLVIRNLHFSRNSLEFEVILNSNRDAREFLAETKRKTPFAPIDDPDFGTLPSDWRRKNDH